jgi:NAD(P)-dependent dehydrogenase (short-subunit alcohol dehydrogenase family)
VRSPIRTAFVTGASSGIGHALCRGLLQRGCAVAAAARRMEPLRELEAEGHARGVRVLAVPLDVACTEAIAPALARAAGELGPFDAVVANAGRGRPLRALEWDAGSVREVFAVNLFGAVETLLAAVPHLRGPGSVLAGVSSIAAWRSGPGAAAYNASKAALSSFLEGIRPELRDLGIRVLEVNPGFVHTAMTDRNAFPMPFRIGAADAARRIVRALEGRRNRLAFPLPMALLMGLVRRLPDRVFDALNLRVSRRLASAGVLGREIPSGSPPGQAPSP